MAVKKLKITSCTVDDAGNIKAGGSSFEVQINPAEYTHNYQINYSEEAHLGGLNKKNAFSSLEPEGVTFNKIVIDGTGAIPSADPDAAPVDVRSQIKLLTSIVYRYSGQQHETPWVRLVWGSLIFFGRLKTMSTKYTLFKPNGEPLRAEVDLAFGGAMSAQEEALRANRSSPDLSHKVTVVAGDTLPLLCYRIYRDSSYYPEVARFNRLTDFRRLTPGTSLLFPPLG